MRTIQAWVRTVRSAAAMWGVAAALTVGVMGCAPNPFASGGTASTPAAASQPAAGATQAAASPGGQGQPEFTLPGVADAGQDALSQAAIRKQQAVARDLMEERPMRGQRLADGAVRFTLTAEPVTWHLYLKKNVKAWGYNGQVPGPLIRVQVGEKVKIVLRNHLPVPTTLRFPGLSVPAGVERMGGTSQWAVTPGSSFTYQFTVTKDMVGTHLYCSGTDMETQIDRGLHGVLQVDQAGGQPQDRVDALFEIGSFTVDQATMDNVFLLDGKPYPLAPELTVRRGERVRLRFVNNSPDCYHAMHLHGYTFWLVAEDGRPLPKPRPMNVVNLAPEETADIEFVANHPGTWMLHCHILDHMMNPGDAVEGMGGLTTFVRVLR
ncbi:multicopper oxidase family protein [Alicyclobacillus shizuokensis]|uniref:multicopper oxidase family protein n=1 Tax=Alicyclobacillus shizuokensis TaxID=392014 RepID=UPI000833B4D0|nr:multicopper oxidase domain-containing protein [Alicyclobacillus shizuokensis]